MGYRIGIDVGGTFTDFLVVDSKGGFTLWKHRTTPEDQSVGVMEGLRELAEQRGMKTRDFLEQADLIIHGTTTADNTMIEQTGAKTGLLVTKGRRDEIELRRGYKENIWDPSAPGPFKITPRRYRLTLEERLDYQGNVLKDLDEDEVRAQVRRLKKGGVSSIAVVLLFSFVNPAHEQRVGEIITSSSLRSNVCSSKCILYAVERWDRGGAVGRGAADRDAGERPRRRRDGRVRDRRSGRGQGLHLGRHGRHVVRRVLDPRRAADDQVVLELGAPVPDRAADGRRGFDRRRRRLDREGRGRRVASRSGVGRR
ncbi:MAG: hypothetical protein E6G59_00720 [Actinobacteria bacterium]|nr:MAG: hypothetical protein E6G59_00720 [Actinomycetota bacterium]